LLAADAARQPKYDLAISFLSKDLPTATALHDRLSEGLKVFFYPHAQVVLAGTDGMASMREPFLTSRLIVILYQEPWGETPWTRIEQSAIQDRFLKEGWEAMFFITVGRPSKLPAWLPDHRVRFSLDDFPLEQAVGAIKHRVTELGGTISPMTPARKAQEHAAEAKYQKDRKTFFMSDDAVRAARAEVAKIFGSIQQSCDHAKTESGLDLIYGASGSQFVVRDQRVGMAVDWTMEVVNSVRGAELKVTAYSKPIPLPGQPRFGYYGDEPRRSSIARYKPELGRDGSLCWQHDGQLLSSQAVADKCFIDFLDYANENLTR
jgi:hypothetical protein